MSSALLPPEPSALIVNWLEVDADRVLVGATDDLNWQASVDDGGVGGDARTLVTVTLEDPGRGRAVEEVVRLYCRPDEAARAVVLRGLPGLAALAWRIRRGEWSEAVVNEHFFGAKMELDG